MRTNYQYYMSSFKRVQAFLNENAAQVGAIKASKSGKVLDEVIGQLEQHGVAQSTARLEIGGRANLQQSLEAALKKEHLLPIASFARANLRGVPDYATLTRSVIKLRGPALVRAARAVAAAAQPYVAALEEDGFPFDTLASLSAAADKVEGTLEAKASLKVRRGGSTAAISEETKRGVAAVRSLSAVVERQFAKDKSFLSSWRLAKRVVTKPGIPRGTVASSPAAAAGTANGSAV
jgi:hypothetical protein